MLLSTFIGKPVLSPAGASYGYVLAARPSRDFKTLSCLVCADADEEEFYLPMRAVRSAGDALVAGKARLLSPTGIAFRAGSAAYTSEGELLGAVCDVRLGEEPELLLFGGGKTFSVPVRLAVFGERVVLYPDEAKRAAAARLSRKQTRLPVKNEVPVSEGEAQKEKQSEPEEKKANSIRLLNRTNLLGRRIKRSVFDSRGNPIALAGERVTPAILSAARSCNRLLELTVNTLTTLY